MNAIRDTPPPTRAHLSESASGKCWCGHDATAEHAKQKNPRVDDGAARVYREG